ncbi:hypothetical protein LNW71_29225 [Streptomyces sp. RKAG290]|nr:hypothetical protein [Streptomyces sp. RKAG290]MCM2415404.1 hypothetical protein [Streptomyces sp. RKAG290]
MVQEPEAQLGRGERHPLGPLRLPQRGTCHRLAARFDVFGQSSGCRALEEVPDGDLDAEGLPDAADEPGGEQGMSAEVEEVVVDGDGRQCEYLCEETAQDLLDRPPGRTPGGVVAELGCGQGASVDLAVDGERDLVQDHEGGRDHVVGQQS